MRSDEQAPTLRLCQAQPWLPGLEAAARAAIEERRGRSLTEPEWARTRENLRQLARLLRAWELPADSRGGTYWESDQALAA